MQRSLTTEKTTVMTVQGKDIQLASLPLTIRYEIDTLEYLKGKEIEKALEYEAAVLAMKSKEAQIARMALEHLAKESANATGTE